MCLVAVCVCLVWFYVWISLFVYLVGAFVGVGCFTGFCWIVWFAGS